METNSSPPETKVTPLHQNDAQTKDEPGYRTPPLNYDAERALLGAILVNNPAYEKVSDFLKPEHFADPVHGRIYAATGKLVERGQIADPRTLKNFFEQDGALADIGGSGYLARLAEESVTVLNAAEYGRIIHDLALRRELITLGNDVVNDAYIHDLEVAATDLIESAEQGLFELATTGQYEGGFQTFGRSLETAIREAEAAFKRESQLTGVATGLKDLDKLLGGLHSSDLIILAGRPSMGKTALATNIAFHAARQFREERDEQGGTTVKDGAIIAFFSLEMAAEQLATRILSEESRVGSDKIRRGDISTDDFQRIFQTSQELSALPLYIDDTAALTISAIRTRARRLKRSRGLGLIIVDYLQLLTGSSRQRNENRVQEVSEITRGLKALAKELDVPVVALSQLSRKVEERDDKRPQLADLRESGAIEQDADVVMFIFREEYYVARREPKEGTEEHMEWMQAMEKVHNLAELIIAKQRHGPIGKVTLYFDSLSTKFTDWAKSDHLPDRDS